MPRELLLEVRQVGPVAVDGNAVRLVAEDGVGAELLSGLGAGDHQADAAVAGEVQCAAEFGDGAVRVAADVATGAQRGRVVTNICMTKATS